MTGDDSDYEENYFTLVGEQGMCLVGDTIINLNKVEVIRKLEGKTLIYRAGVADPVILPVGAFDVIRDAVFDVDGYDDDEEEYDDEDEDEE